MCEMGFAYTFKQPAIIISKETFTITYHNDFCNNDFLFQGISGHYIEDNSELFVLLFLRIDIDLCRFLHYPKFSLSLVAPHPP